MNSILRLFGIVLVGMCGLSAFSQQERAVYSVVFEEGALPVTGDPFGDGNRYLAKVSILVTTNTSSVIIIIFRKDSPRRPSMPKNFRID
jgi:hypothetical protein